MNGASLRLTDHEGFTPLDIVVKDRLPYIEYQHSDPSDVYAWGSNFNYNLGIGNSQIKSVPEVLEVFQKDSIDIQQVVICKFHSVFLSSNGHVYTCGHGFGGRLGHSTEDILLVPTPVKGLGLLSCKQVAAGQDHLMLLMENGQVWSCGLNTYHQLGHVPPPEKLLLPKPLNLKLLKGKSIIGICAARFHSVIYTKDSVYTFGLNAGQLGHPKGDRTQINPRQVSGLNTEGCHLTYVATSDGAVVCATSRGDIYVLHEYLIRKIASRQLEISKLSMVGGHLDSCSDVSGIRESSGLELQVLLLTKFGKVYLWKQTDPYLRRCFFTSTKKLVISDIHINGFSIGLITIDNEGYIGTVIPYKGKRSAPPPIALHIPTLSSSLGSVGLTVLLDPDDCHFIRVKKLPQIYRGTSITSDSKGRNYAVLQSNPKMGLVELPMISDSKIQQDFTRMYKETHQQDEFHDIVIKVGKREFAAHKFILSSRTETFEQILKYIYTNHCDFLVNGYEVNWKAIKQDGKKAKSAKNKASNPIHILQEACKRFSLNCLSKRLDGIQLIDGKITVIESDKMKCLTFDRQSMSNLYDVNLISSNGTTFGCHKCILAARLDYFHSMLGTCWAENSQLSNLSLPISSEIMEILIEYLYTDEANKLFDSDNIEFLCHILMISDQLLVPRLKEFCEMALIKQLSLKNAAELLELSSIYNSEQLKKSCMQFICINLPAVIESKILEVLSDEVMEELSTYYRGLVPWMYSRRITMNKNAFGKDLELLEKEFPISDTSVFVKHKADSHDRKRYRTHCTSHSDDKEVSLVDKVESKTKSPDKDYLLNILTPNVNEKKIGAKKPGQWIMECPKEELLSLDKIMMSEQLNLTPLQRKTIFPDKKPLPHLSQKQKKMLKANRAQSQAIPIPTSPPSQSVCPWAKSPEQSLPSPSFWDSLAKKELQPTTLNRDFSTPLEGLSATDDAGKKSKPMDNINSCASSPQDIVISLRDIQLAEEKKQHRAFNLKIKPLHILNIEDQAIEELIALYNAEDNLKEKITISRVQPDEIVSPIWKRKGH
ncbi:inhibitor of Bruton tyrosine kinase [Trichonephila inaurata madagascariensis]|uniref:Inhibitor of Bruton tyrosine kinase n=1 Tax=Trichonephila inaurata madagascariensis TaxID=2747483 RepID=A0A8X7C227_9ARAC|nr:inhibitor of Bruton tyrosine kinase [Trichonephila inaurata madagascariensis]